MGTNYYRKRIPTEAEREELHTLLDEYMDGVNSDHVFRERFEQINEEVHICKMSYGWQVCFDHNWGKYYQPNRKDLERFLSEPGTVIEDEYGKRFSPKEFWDLVKEHNSSKHNKFTSKTYREYEKRKGNTTYYLSKEDIKKAKHQFNIDIHDENDFLVDGLRFAVYSDFC